MVARLRVLGIQTTGKIIISDKRLNLLFLKNLLCRSFKDYFRSRKTSVINAAKMLRQIQILQIHYNIMQHQVVKQLR